jgi:hypothetical protein
MEDKSTKNKCTYPTFRFHATVKVNTNDNCQILIGKAKQRINYYNLKLLKKTTKKKIVHNILSKKEQEERI